MTDLFKIVLTAGLTVVGGLLVFVLQRFVLEPINDQAKVIGKIAYALFFHGKDLNSPELSTSADEETLPERIEAKRRFRELAAELTQTSQAIRWYHLWASIRLIPKTERVDGAVGCLTGLSNSIILHANEFRHETVTTNWQSADEVKRLLRIRKWGAAAK